jgi:hypothetical protein
MAYDPNERPTMAQVCEDAWLNEAQARQDEVEHALKARKEASQDRKAKEKQKVRSADAA